MSDTYLVTTYADKDQVKALGARWDPARRQWRVPAGLDLAPFARWLPQGLTLEPSPRPAVVAQGSGMALVEPGIGPVGFGGSTGALAPADAKGISLSRLLGGVAMAVSDAFREGVWTTVEVVDVRARNHVYLEVSERDLSGNTVAKAHAVIWSSVAQRILPAFQRATGGELAAGLKLLVRARPVFKAQYGFSLEVDEIDPNYTLGDLEATKREIRERLRREGLFELNRELPPPWDFNHVLVVAPEGGAGLGDFQAEASRLERHGLCRFIYVYSRFQGEGAPTEIRLELLAALEQIRANHPWLPDAVVLIRGGGAVNDMAWLNDYALARTLCELPVPVFTGIGHERDNTVLDEVAHQRFDTPSKVIAGIEQVIRERAQQARALFDGISSQARRSVEQARLQAVQLRAQVHAGALAQVALAKAGAGQAMTDVRLHAGGTVRQATDAAQSRLGEVQQLARAQLQTAQRETPALIGEIRAEARQMLRSARLQVHSDLQAIRSQARADLRQQQDHLDRSLSDVGTLARQAVAQARQGSESLMREIAGQGPGKTLSRGFALVRADSGLPITSASTPALEVTLQFHDGQRAATLLKP